MRRISIILCVVSFLTLYIIETHFPDQCALCGGGSYAAPCLVDLAGGTVTELDISNTDSADVFCLKNGIALTVAETEEGRRCAAYVPERTAAMDRSLYCRRCRGLLAGLRGYALADLRVPENIQVYPLASRTMGLYTVSVSGGTVEVWR